MGSAKINFPPGVYFNPADDDLIQFFLKPKALGENLVYDVVEEKQVYGSNCSPYRIFDPNFCFVNPEKKSSEKVWYVFTNLSKIGKGKMSRSRRSRVNMKKEAGLGTWVGETSKKKIMDSLENVIGETRLLVYKNNKIDPAAGEAQFGYYKMHEYSLSGIYANFDLASTLVLCKITFDSSKRCSSIQKKPKPSPSPSPSPSFVAPKRKRVSNKSSNHKKKNLERGVGDQPSFVAPKRKRVSNKSSNHKKMNLERGVGDHFVEGSVCDPLAGTTCESGAGDNLCDSLVGVPNITEFGEDLGVDVNLCFGVGGDHDPLQGRVCDSLAGTICESGAGDNLEVGVQCITEFDIGDFGGSSDNLIKETACDSLVGFPNITDFGENFGLDQPPPVNFCFGASGGHDPVEGSVCVNEFRDDLYLDDLHVGFCFEDEWIQELMNPIQDSAMTNLGKRKFEAENSCMAKKVVLAAQLFCCTGKFIGHGVFEKRAPALLDNLIQGFIVASFFVLLEVIVITYFIKFNKKDVDKTIYIKYLIYVDPVLLVRGGHKVSIPIFKRNQFRDYEYIIQYIMLGNMWCC